jgi:deazaflavin-dependent oxidoreductase (nitroreductase family)
MTSDMLRALQGEEEIELSVKGRKSGRLIPRPVWFVLESGKILLVPVKGSSTQWYRNILEEPEVGIRVRGRTYAGRVKPITQENRVKEVVALFTSKYGEKAMDSYYTSLSVAAEVALPEGNT